MAQFSTTTRSLQRWLVDTLESTARRLHERWFPSVRIYQLRQGRLTEFHAAGSRMGYPSYRVSSVRGKFTLGYIEYRNQWGYYGFTPLHDDVDTPLNMEILAEIYAFLRLLGQRGSTPVDERQKNDGFTGRVRH